MKPSQVVRGKTALDFAFDIAFSEEEKPLKDGDRGCFYRRCKPQTGYGPMQ